MEKPKFAYYVTDKDASFILIFEYDDVNFEKTTDALHRYITDEKELAEYIKKYPKSASFYHSDETEAEAKRLNEKYGLELP